MNPLSSIAKSAVVLALLAASSQARETPVVHATRASTPPNIDGLLDDPVWHQAPAIADFFQRDPVEGAPPTEQTQVRILFDDHYLYFALRCFDSEADRLVANQMRRDAELDENDNIQIILDPYNDHRGGFYFSTNPLGARQDLLLTDEGRTRNQAWDSVWQSRTHIDSLGWSAEVAIPFDQVRYPDSDQAVWGINIGRAIRRKNEEVFLVPPPQSYGFMGRYRTSRLAVLTGLGRLQSRPPLAVVPFFLSGTQRDFTADGSTEYDLDPGLDFKYGLTPSLTLDLSYKTDFAQVEADQEQSTSLASACSSPKSATSSSKEPAFLNLANASKDRALAAGHPPCCSTAAASALKRVTTYPYWPEANSPDGPAPTKLVPCA